MSDTVINSPEWVPFPVKEIGKIIDSFELSDIQKVEALTRHLDKRISLASVENPPGHKYPTSHKPDPAGEYAGLIRAIADKNNRTDSPGRPKAVQLVLSRLDNLPDIVNKEQVRCYLYIALAYAGGNVPESKLLGLLNDAETSPAMIQVILQAMEKSAVPIRALPRLLELTKNSYHYVFMLDIGPPNPRRIYPIREAALAALTQLGIQAKAVSIADENVDPGWKARLSTTVIEVDQKSIVTNLRQWLGSDDPQIWKPAAEIIPQIPGNDVQEMVAELMKQNTLSAEKKRALKHH